VLGPIAEENLSLGLQASNGSFWPIVTQPLSLVFILIALAMLLVPHLKTRLGSVLTASPQEPLK
ncbi:MAG: hypothetical protein L7W43_08785, partial [Rubripirellula sp.]|nr:hypothetical protein [Rubripirellula sp.]